MTPVEIGTAWLARRLSPSDLEALAAQDTRQLASAAYSIGKRLSAVNDQECRLRERAASLQGVRP